MLQTCPFCSKPIPPDSIFCPYCGKPLQDRPLSVSVMKQIGIYALSFFLPPLGLWPAFKYLRQEDTKAKTIGAIAIILTVISIALSLVIFGEVMKSINQSVSSQLNMYQQLQ